MRTYDEAYDASADEPAFSNSTDGEDWMGRWCERCVHDSPELVDKGEGCPLILVALLGRTPAEWLEQPSTPAGMWADGTPRTDPPRDAYHCVEFRDRDGPGPGYEPPPDPPLPGQVELFTAEPYTGVRMYADVAADARRVRAVA